MWSITAWQISDKGQCDGLLGVPSDTFRSGGTGKELDEKELWACWEGRGGEGARRRN